MSQGANADPNFLWHGNMKINTPTMSFNTKFHVAEKPEADAITALGAISALMLRFMSTDSNIVYAVVSKDNHQKDSRFSRGSLGAGSYLQDAVGPAPQDYNRPDDAILIRFEHAGGGSVTRKFGPIADGLIVSNELTGVLPADVVAPVIVAPPPYVALDTFPVIVNKFMKAWMFYTNHVKSGHPPGGAYEYFTWTAAYFLRVGRKKGGRPLPL